MSSPIHLTTSPSTRSKSIPRVPLLCACFVIALAWSAPEARGVTPAPDGGYGGFNTAEGQSALFHLTSGTYNTANGGQALFSDTTGTYNTATGLNALYHNSTGAGNTANGGATLFNNTTGSGSTAIGFQALFSNTTGNNSATGYQTLFSNTTGTGNVATGYQALLRNTIGTGNTAIGGLALQFNTNGNSNTALGRQALFHNTTGTNNIGLGQNAGGSLTTGSYNIDIGRDVTGAAGESNTIRIGSDTQQTRAFVAGIFGAAITGNQVVVNSSGQLGVASISSARFKDDIRPMDKESEAVLALKPITFHYKKEIDPKSTPQFGLVAEEVEKINSNLVTHDNHGQLYTVRYDAINAMLLNEFLKEHRKVEEQDRQLQEQREQIKALTAGLQRVSDELELRRTAPRTAKNGP